MKVRWTNLLIVLLWALMFYLGYLSWRTVYFLIEAYLK